MKEFLRKIYRFTRVKFDRLKYKLKGKVYPGDIAICTIHGNSAQYSGEFAARYAWPKLQIQQLRNYTESGYTVFAYGNKLMPEHEKFLKNCREVNFISCRNVLNGIFDHVWPIRNWLTRIAVCSHKLIIHLDSDAFPVKGGWIDRYAKLLSRKSPVVAVKRLENGDTHSDRCFLMFSRKGFKKHAFDFSKVGVPDSGGGISENLEKDGYRWKPLLRSNKHNYHPVISAIYDDSVYHHGAGSRNPRLRFNQEIWEKETEWNNEKKLHRVLMKRLFENTDDFISELRGEKDPYIFPIETEGPDS